MKIHNIFWRRLTTLPFLHRMLHSASFHPLPRDIKREALPVLTQGMASIHIPWVRVRVGPRMFSFNMHMYTHRQTDTKILPLRSTDGLPVTMLCLSRLLLLLIYWCFYQRRCCLTLTSVSVFRVLSSLVSESFSCTNAAHTLSVLLVSARSATQSYRCCIIKCALICEHCVRASSESLLHTCSFVQKRFDQMSESLSFALY